MKKIFGSLNYGLLILVFLYSLSGLLMIFSASSVSSVLRYNVPYNYFFLRQLLFVIIGIAFSFVWLFIPTKSYRLFGKIAMYGILVLLAFIFVAGKVAGGAQSWYEVGIFNFQPSEFAKLILIIYLAIYYNRISTKKKISFMNMFYPLIVCVVLFVLIAAQPDLGGAFIIFLISGLIFISIPFGRRHKRNIYKLGTVFVVIAALVLLISGKHLLHSYQLTRILSFNAPCARYKEDTGYQVCNGYIAIHNGGLMGVGLGKSTQKYLYLPESHTDFIFPIICEELGLLVGILVVIGYFIMLFIILNIAKSATNLRNSILCYGIFVYLLSNILINLLGILGLIPLTGVPLPFLSYGGSYYLCVISCMFIVQRINYENKQDKIKEKIKNM